MTSTMSQFHTVHPIMPESFEQVKMLDRYSDNYVYIMLEDIEKAYKTALPSDIYILNGYQNFILGSKLVKEAIEQKLKNDHTIKNIFLTILDIYLKDFY